MEATAEKDPTSAATPATARTWQAHPGLARLLRVSITLVPLIAVSFAAWQIHLALGPPGELIEGVARWAALSAGGTIAIRLIDRVAKRLLPLTVLLHMSVVFPDDVPSRFRVAMRHGSTRQLARDVADESLGKATPQEAAEKLLGLVTQLSRHDRLTRGHTERVRAYADLVAEQMGFGLEERQKMHWAGLIHDIGKLSVPSVILNKRTPLSDREWAQIKLHPNEGWALIQPLRGWLGEWARATRDHHEKWDGTGYPRGLAGHEISRGGRIVAVVDAFDVMTTTRSYKETLSFDEARAELAACSGTQFDPEVVRAFLALSLSKRRRRWSIISWFANSPIAASVTTGAGVPTTVVTAMAAATIAAGTMLAPTVPVEELAAERVVVETTTTLAPPTTSEAPPTTAVPTAAAPTTTSTSTTSTTTAAPTTTVPTATSVTPPPTTTSAAPTTTTAPSSTFSTGFLGGGAGDVLQLVASVAGGGTLNIEDDAAPGLTIPRSPDGLIEISSASVRAWSLPIGEETILRGRATLRLHVATSGFADGFGVVIAGLVECRQPSSSCATISSGQSGFAQVGFGSGFGEIEIYLGEVDHTLSAGGHLLVTVAVPEASTHDLWVEFGSSAYPSEFRLS